MNQLGKNWLTLVASAVLSFIMAMLVYSFSQGKYNVNKDLKIELESKATFIYVDKQNELLRKEIQSNNEQHYLMIDMIKEMRQENQANFIEIRKQLYRK